MLQVRVKIDHDIAAAEDVEFSEGRVEDDIVLREQHKFTNVLGYEKPVALRPEETAQALAPNALADRRTVVSTARPGDGIGAQISRELL